MKTTVALAALVTVAHALSPAFVRQRNAGASVAMAALRAEDSPFLMDKEDGSSSAAATNFNPSEWLENMFSSIEAELALEDLKKMGESVAGTVLEVSGRVASEIKAKSEEQIVAALEERNAAIKLELTHHAIYNKGVDHLKR